MSDSTPFIKKFTIDNKKYIYCANTNRIMQVDLIIYEIIAYKYGIIPEELLNKYGKKKINYALNELNSIEKEIGFAKSRRPENIRVNIDDQEYGRKIYNEMKMISLCVTRKCNMSCLYCTYGRLNNDRRKDTPEFMSLSTAQKSMDMIYRNSGKQGTISVTFYGGEPLLCFDLIKETVKYINVLNNNGNGKKINVYITSNGTLLNKEIILWLMDNNVNLLISLDGPRSLHDRYRKFKNGKKTYDRIIDRLKMLKRISEEYYYSKVRFNIVLSPPREYDSLYRYLLENDIIPIKNVRMQNMNYDESGYFRRIEYEAGPREDQYEEIVEDYFKICNIKIRSEYEDNRLKMLKSLIGMEFEKYVNRKIENECCITITNPICEPGILRCFVLTDGSIYPCESIKEYPYLEVGNVYEGFYKNRNGEFAGYRLIKEFIEVLKKECIQCWAYRYCSYKTCFKTGCEKNGFSKIALRKSCENMRRSIEREMKFYLIYENRYPNVFKNAFKRRGVNATPGGIDKN